MTDNPGRQKNMPRLRFPEFRGKGAWHRESLGQVFSERQDKNFINLQLLSLTDKEGIIPQEETNRKNNSSSDKSKYLRVLPGDVAYNTMRMWEGRSAYVDIEGLVSPAYTVCQPKMEHNGLFFSYYFKTHGLIQQFRRYSQGLVKDTLSLKFEAFSVIEAPIPYPEEQQKIADCLSSIDKLITAQTQKLDTLKAHKKGLMQQLFPAEGETAPRLRFPEFRDKGEWEEKPLDQVCMLNPSVNELPKIFVYIDLESVEAGKLLQKKVIPLQNAPSRAQRLLKSCDIIFQMVRPYQKNNYYFQSSDALEYVASTGYAQLRANESNMYLYQYLHSDRFVGKVLDKCTGSNYPAINSSDLSKIIVEVPASKEQQKIAACLSSIDKLITAQSQKIDALKAHKKGLMQQLFPAMD